MAYVNGVDPDQTAPEGAVWSGFTLFGIPLYICILVKKLHKKQNLGQKGIKLNIWKFRTFTVGIFPHFL